MNIRTGEIIQDWQDKNPASPIFIGEFHPDIYSAELTTELIMYIHDNISQSVGLYSEGFPTNHKKGGFTKYNVFAWNPRKYGLMLEKSGSLCKIHGLDNGAFAGRREEQMAKKIRAGKEKVKVVLCGVSHVNYYEGVIPLVGCNKKKGFVIASVDRVPLPALREIGKLPVMVRFKESKKLSKIYVIKEEKTPTGDWLLCTKKY